MSLGNCIVYRATKLENMRKKLIDKDALAREIEKLKSNLIYGACASQIAMETRCKEEAYNEVLSYLDTLEVKDVDLKNELKEDWLFADKIEVDCLESMCLTEDMFASLAKKYFELGIKAQK